jgi:hypothetical protein
MANIIIHKADSRGHYDHGWLDTYHTFSFGDYYEQERMNFGVLRVLNDDRVNAGKGFGTHPHDNMEIVSIPLEGTLEHKDSMGNVAVIKSGDVQAMSAGTGIYHSEYNKNFDKEARFLQIWIFPNKLNVEPRYEQITLDSGDYQNKFLQIVSPNPGNEGVWIHQNAWFSIGEFDKNFSMEYTPKQKENGVYAFIIEGDFNIDGNILGRRDGAGIWDADKIFLKSGSPGSKVLLIDVPMKNEL